MTILELCKGINLHPQMQEQVLEFAKDYDFSQVKKQLCDFKTYEKMENAWKELEQILGDDPAKVKMLTCMLKAAVDLYEVYQQRGISDEIFFDTMGCYSRFIRETLFMTGELCYDRYWFTTRQSGLHEFRIGQLEYEMNPQDGMMVISMHIPTDAVFTPEEVGKSITMAKEFFHKQFPELDGCEYRCHSWLLDPQLKEMLPENSNIVSYQNRFELTDDGEQSWDTLQWLFRTTSRDLTSLSEESSLQRKVKQHLLSGGVMKNYRGRLK